MRALAAVCTSLVLALLSACTAQPSGDWQRIEAPTLAQLDGTWLGQWKTDKQQGEMHVTIYPATNYSVTSITGDPYSTKNTWQSAISIKGGEVIIDAHGFSRVETYALYTARNGKLMLDGNYTYKGKSWGKATLYRQP